MCELGWLFNRVGAYVNAHEFDSLGLRLANGTQQASVSHCSFHDLSGGGICLGNVDDSAEEDPAYQMARITVEDNSITAVPSPPHHIPSQPHTPNKSSSCFDMCARWLRDCAVQLGATTA